ncbi:MAG: hypothetical protein E1N59_5 [Puniceicoccaceae bacterium 5H]|nr:MAG: hypothetical protein E1N59_5 [Puniceicoccaceae bacterium 5H]
MRYLLLLFGILSACVAFAADKIQIDGAAFRLELADGQTIHRSDLHAVTKDDAEMVRLTCEHPALEVRLTQEQVGAGYRRTRLEITNRGAEDLPLQRIVLLDQTAPAGAHVVGETTGSPIVAGIAFVGVEHPFAENTLEDGRIVCALPIMLPLRPGEQAVASLVYGEAPEPSQLRRAFAAYLNDARPRAYAPFLLHNTWYNLGYSNMFSEQEELELIETLGHELVEQRGVQIDAFVLDDGWDDTKTLWRFHAGWPDGLANMKTATVEWGAVPGIWISPWGGYNQPKKERLAAAAGEGFEVRDGGFSLAGHCYYQRFRALCVQAIREGGVGFFKFDGIGAKDGGKIDPSAGRDFDAMLHLITELRQLEPDLYVSQTVGTWPSPWWLLHVDNIWRGGADHDFAGVGTDRQRWITYRDAQVYQNVVQRAPLFPLGSLMLHGIILAEHADRLATTNDTDFTSEVRSYFGSGAQLQELYLSPELLTPENWDVIAEAAKWARRNADVLADTHWLGGDPAQLEPYGWAAWSPRLGIVTLRNPSAQPQRFALEVGAAFELPADARSEYAVTAAYDDSEAPVDRLVEGQAVEVELEPFQVLVLEARPLKR